MQKKYFITITAISFLLRLSVTNAATCNNVTIEKISNPASAKVKLTSPDGSARMEKVLGEIKPQETIETDAQTTVDLRLCEGSVIRIDKNTSYTVQTPSVENGLIAWVFNLNKGDIRAKVTPSEQKDFVKFRLQTPSGSVGIRGTEFYTSYQEKNDQTSLFTFSGKVLFGKKEAFSKLSSAANTEQNNSFELVGKNMASFVNNKMSAPSKPKSFDPKIFRRKTVFNSSLAASTPSSGGSPPTASAEPTETAKAPTVSTSVSEAPASIAGVKSKPAVTPPKPKK